MGNLAADVYHYLAGEAQIFNGAGTPSALADADGYATPWGLFASPLTAESLCAETYIIFIGNPDSNGPEIDSAFNSSVLAGLYSEFNMNPPGALAGASSGGLSMPQYQTVSVSSGVSNQVDLGLSAQCYLEPSTCSSGILANPLETVEVEGACVDAAAGCFCSTSNKAADRSKGDLSLIPHLTLPTIYSV